MRSADEAYSRIRWDPSFDETRFVVGYEARRAEPAEIALVDFVPGGDIPWHRVLYFAADGERLWDRHRRLDRILDGDPSGAGRVRVATPALPDGFFQSRPVYRFEAAAERWTPAPATVGAATSIGALTVLTYNVLFDTYEAERIATAERIPGLVALLGDADADVIALQEVQPPLLRALLAAPWVRASYAVSDGPDARCVDPSGVLLLSRLPVRQLAWHVFSNKKQVLAAVLDHGAQALVVATVHLTSDYADDAAQKREREMHSLVEALTHQPDVVLLGDFNLMDPGLPAALAEAAFVDTWPAVNGGDPGYTYDPLQNPLARLMSRSGRRGRLDRVLLRGACRPRAARLLGTEPLPGGALYPSDHFGVGAELVVQSAQAVATLGDAPTRRTSLALVPDAACWPAIQRLRARHDPAVDRWPPHLNLLHGFVPEVRHEQAAALVAEVARRHPPTTLRLAEIRAFRHPESVTLWLAPEPSAPLVALQRDLQEQFPGCRQQQRTGVGFTPHLTIGRLAPEADVDAVLRTLNQAWEPVDVLLDAVALLARRGDSPFEVRGTVALGTGHMGESRRDALSLSMTLDATTEPLARAQRARRLFNDLRRLGEHVELLGSRRMGTETATSDLDLVCVTPCAPEAWAVRVRHLGEVRHISDARVPLVELRQGALVADIAVVPCPPGVAPEQAVGERHRFPEPHRTSLAAAADADALLAYAEGTAGLAAFTRLTRAIKTWAYRRGLHDTAFGFVGGLGWAVMCARVAAEGAADEPLVDALERFFATFGAWDWRQPVALDDGEAPADAAAIRVLTPSAPSRNIARSTLETTARVLQEDLFEAHERLEQARASGDYGPLVSPPDLHTWHASVLRVGLGRDAGAVAPGWLRGRMLSLLVGLERLGFTRLRPWPHPLAGAGVAYAVALGPEPVQTSDVEPAVDALRAQLPAALGPLEAEVLPIGELPTFHAPTV